jgi:hypothetical protein
MYPETFYGHLIATLEIMAGLFGVAVVTNYRSQSIQFGHF